MEPIRVGWQSAISVGRPCVDCGDKRERVASSRHPKTGHKITERVCFKCKEVKHA